MFSDIELVCVQSFIELNTKDPLNADLKCL